MPASPQPAPLQRRIRQQMRDEVAQAALRLFVEDGYDETTVDQICTAAGISRRSFFRYFSTKESVVVSLIAGHAEDGAAVFAEQAAVTDIWTALRRSLDPFQKWVETDPTQARALMRLIESTPALLAAYLVKLDDFGRRFADTITARVDPTAEQRLVANVIASAAMGALVEAGRCWSDSNGRQPLSQFLDVSFNALRSTAPAGSPAF